MLARQFAAAVEPTNAAVQSKLAWASAQVGDGKPTVPSTLAEERQINPFMRSRCVDGQRARHPRPSWGSLHLTTRACTAAACRCVPGIREAAVQQYTGETEPVKVMHALRDRKNNFKATL